jgi:TRAP-type C4-dicarboxylate transport system permease large subunit
MEAIKNNPAVIVGLVRVVALIAVMLGLPFTPEQEAALVVVISLVLTIVSSKLTVPKTPTQDAGPASIQEPPA